ncbi:hypothetical protein AVEN_229171-1 [Araneus ventricosus]|uniref:Uncharacterized protein n=1 Tax=Araneus ventricosus TaxID=182803 RepID=A0A4Y2JP60_ARAVE|nr:hypothetical protein AVEN_229171-1 [Araneus ventricosus]
MVVITGTNSLLTGVNLSFQSPLQSLLLRLNGTLSMENSSAQYVEKSSVGKIIFLFTTDIIRQRRPLVAIVVKIDSLRNTIRPVISKSTEMRELLCAKNMIEDLQRNVN